MSIVENTVSNFALILQGFNNMLSNQDKNLNIVYDPDLRYESSVSSQRRYYSSFDIRKVQKFPLFMYSVSSMRFMTPYQPYNTLFKNFSKPEYITDENNNQKIDYYKRFNILDGEFKLKFLLLTNKLEHLFNFQILYTSESYFTNLRNYDIYVNGIDSNLSYSVYWNALLDSNFTVSISDKVYQSIGGELLIKGPMFAIQTGEGFPAEKIILQIEDAYNNLLISQETITKDDIDDFK